jgi:hypothetical protein
MVLLIGSLTISKFFAISIISIYLIFKYKEKLPNSLLKNVFLFSFVASALILLFEFESGAFQHLKGVTSVVEIFQEKSSLVLVLVRLETTLMLNLKPRILVLKADLAMSLRSLV